MNFLKSMNGLLKRTEDRLHAKGEAFWILTSAALSFVFLLIASKSSPIYPMNDWVDMHCFFTVGRGWHEGMIPYRDLVEQKGPLLYAAYALIAAISSGSFVSVFALEVVTFALFLWLSSKILRMAVNTPALISIGLIMMTACIVLSKAFCHGGSLEETTMFLPMYSLYAILRAQKEKRLLLSREALIHGVCAGICLMTKYTICGFYLGLALAVALWYLLAKEGRALLNVIGSFLAGVFLVVGITALYFAANGALDDLWKCYFYNNIFVYTGSEEKKTLLQAVWSAVSQAGQGLALRFGENKTFAALIVGGLGWLGICGKGKGFSLATVLLSMVCLVFTTFFTGWSCTYYLMILAPFCVFGTAAMISAVEYILRGRSAAALIRHGLIGALLLFSLITVYRKSDNTYLIRYEREEMPQYRFAETIKSKEEPTLLNFDFLDGGFYYTSGAKPADAYFCALMANIPGMREAQRACIENGKADFVVTQNRKLSDYPWIDSSLYEMVDEASFRFEDDVPIYYLYQKK